jgi:hypothetical protein
MGNASNKATKDFFEKPIKVIAEDGKKMIQGHEENFNEAWGNLRRTAKQVGNEIKDVAVQDVYSKGLRPAVDAIATTNKDVFSANTLSKAQDILVNDVYKEGLRDTIYKEGLRDTVYKQGIIPAWEYLTRDTGSTGYMATYQPPAGLDPVYYPAPAPVNNYYYNYNTTPTTSTPTPTPDPVPTPTGAIVRDEGVPAEKLLAVPGFEEVELRREEMAGLSAGLIATAVAAKYTQQWWMLGAYVGAGILGVSLYRTYLDRQ